jgi:hypothetical protein
MKLKISALLIFGFSLFAFGCVSSAHRKSIASNSVQFQAQGDFKCPQVSVRMISQGGFDSKQYKFWAQGCGYKAKYIVMCSTWEAHCEKAAVLGKMYYTPQCSKSPGKTY